MTKYRVEETYLMKKWIKKIYECEAEDENDLCSGEIKNEKIISEEEIESEYDGWSEIDDFEEIE